jgi:hypothetical protein
MCCDCDYSPELTRLQMCLLWIFIVLFDLAFVWLLTGIK